MEQLDAAVVNKRLEADEVSLKFLAAPINPSDFNIVSAVDVMSSPPLACTETLKLTALFVHVVVLLWLFRRRVCTA